MNIVKRMAKWIGYLFVALFLIALAQIGYGYFKEPASRQSAMDLCAAIKPGDLADGLDLKAKDKGADIARWSARGDGQRVLLATFVGVPPFSRHICMIKADAKLVLEAKYTYMD